MIFMNAGALFWERENFKNERKTINLDVLVSRRGGDANRRDSQRTRDETGAGREERREGGGGISLPSPMPFMSEQFSNCFVRKINRRF